MLAWSSLAWTQTAQADEDAVAFFEKHIRPALTEHCLDCHSSETEASGNLLLDSREGWTNGGDFGPAIRPGDSKNSLLMRVIRGDEPDLQMPPDGKLEDSTIELFRRWIESGAHDPREGTATPQVESTALPVERAQEHWAYRPLESFPEGAFGANRGTIDALINAKLKSRGLSAAGPADEQVLLRRLALDLTGLPPRAEHAKQIETTHPAQAWDRLIESMLASPEFGETFGRRWLDVVRYAESITLRGFVLPQAWRYRDYVIDSFAQDRGFDQMILDQLAGDLLIKGHEDALSLQERQQCVIATGYLALGNTNLEDQDKTKLEFDHIDEQLETIGRTFLGQTLGCARCHDHKFDPIPTADYYALAAIMRSTVAMQHDNVSAWIDHDLPLEREREKQQQTLVTKRNRLSDELKELQEQLRDSNAPPRSTPIHKLRGIVVDDQDAKFVGSWTSSSYSSGYVGEGYRHDENEKQGTKTATFEPKDLAEGVYEVRMAYTSNANRSTKVKVRVFSANETSTVIVNQRRPPDQEGLWVSLGKYPFEKDGLAFVMVSNEGSNGHVIVDAVQFLRVEEDAPDVASLASESKQDPKEAQLVMRRESLEKQRAKLDTQISKRPKYLTVLESEPVDQIAIRIRGVVHHHGAKVERGFLTAVGRSDYWSKQLQSNNSGRLQLAQWIADPQNPLTARVYANRVWSWLMGEGLVTTENNFGTTGQAPTHPRLLDYLAHELIRSGWSTKHLVRLIVRSDAYRRKLEQPDEIRASLDPNNHLYASANLKRLPIESIRDTMLSISGELDRTMGGSTIRNGVKSDYDYVHESNRRSVYQPMFRNALPALYQVFDFADSSVSVGQRARSTVPTQSLALMNHPWVIQRAQKAAQRYAQHDTASSIPEVESDTESLVRQIYLDCLNRQPSSAEQTACVSYLTETNDLAGLIQSVFGTIDFRYLD